MNDLTIVIVSFNTKDLIKNCLESIYTNKPKFQFEIWVVDNASTDGSTKMIKDKFPQVHLIENTQNLGFAVANNQVLTKVPSKYYLLLNSDTKIKEDTLEKLICFIQRNNLDIGSCKLINSDDLPQPNTGDSPALLPLLVWLSGLDDLLGLFNISLPSFHHKKIKKNEHNVGWVSGAVMIITADVINKIGELDSNIFMYGEDVEYCLRATRANFKIGWTDQTEILHLGGRSSQNPSLKQWLGEFKGILYIYQKYYGRVAKWLLKFIIDIFVIIRIIAFLLMGKLNISKIYVQILKNL